MTKSNLSEYLSSKPRLRRRQLLFAAAVIISLFIFPACSKKTHAAVADPIMPGITDKALTISGKQKTAVIKQITDNYSDWKSAEITGKISSVKFFIKPSLKIFMKRSSLLLISVRVPLKGEIARIEADRDSILLVNKFHKLYCKESLEQIARIADVTLTDIQDLLLGRLFIAGRGTISQADAKRIDIFSDQGAFLVVPASQPADALVRYGFRTDWEGRITLLMLASLYDEATAELAYSYQKSGYTLNLAIDRDTKHIKAAIDLDYPKWGAKGFDRIEINNSLRQVSLREFFSLSKF